MFSQKWNIFLMSFIIIWVTKPTYKTRYIAAPLDIQSSHYIAILLNEQFLWEFDMLDENYGGNKKFLLVRWQ